jgi:hypothetical protein
VVVENNRVVRYEDDEEFGINVSFGDLSHADKYFRSKLSESEDYVLVEWDFDDELYEMIQGRINQQTETKWKSKAKWKDVCGCRKPVPTSDSWVIDKKNALHLPRAEWIAVLNTHAKGGAARIYDKSYFAEELEKKKKVKVRVLSPTDMVLIRDPDGDYEISRSEADLCGFAYEEL